MRLAYYSDTFIPAGLLWRVTLTREGSRSPSRAPGRCMAAGTRVAHPLFLIPLPPRGEGDKNARGARGRQADGSATPRWAVHEPAGTQWRGVAVSGPLARQTRAGVTAEEEKAEFPRCHSRAQRVLRRSSEPALSEAEGTPRTAAAARGLPRALPRGIPGSADAARAKRYDSRRSGYSGESRAKRAGSGRLCHCNMQLPVSCLSCGSRLLRAAARGLSASACASESSPK